ncbi:PD-(D/E)XK nuclease family protein [Candidatus Woesearchaeota archaeon]|nr:PD-(D/E)XK nuclease family protein [Candidatus Woesearchaeota archaeon]
MFRTVTSWSNHKLEASKECGRKLGYMLDGVRPDVTFPYFAEGSFLHRRIENFYDELPKWKVKKAETYAGRCRGVWWFSVVNPGKMQGLDIEWRKKLNGNGEWEEDLREKFIRKSNVGVSAINIYNEYFGKQPPINSEFPFNIVLDFKVGGNNYTLGLIGRVDELRSPLLIRETKTGFEEPSIQEYHHGRQVSFYVLGVLNELVNNPNNKELAERFGITQDIKKRIKADPLDVDGILSTEYFLTRTGLINPVSRTKEDIHSLLEDIIKANERVRRGDFSPNPTRNCNGCKWKYKCHNDGDGVSETVDGKKILFKSSNTTVHISSVRVNKKRKEPQRELLPFKV